MQKQLLGLLLLGTLAFSSCKKDAATFQNDFTNEVLSGKPGSGVGRGLTDADGNVYDTVRIGNQTWTVQNFKCSKLNDGTVIDQKSLVATDASALFNATGPAFGYYIDNKRYDGKYGKLYNWAAINSGKLAPPGWHVPTKAEWEALISFLCNCGDLNNDVTSAIGLKASRGWDRCYSDPTVQGTNATGFNALPGGHYFNGGPSCCMGTYTTFWSSTDANNYVWTYQIGYCYGGVSIINYGSEIAYQAALYVRLVKD